MKKIMILVLVSIMLLSVACVKETIKPATKPAAELTNYNADDFSIGYPPNWVIKTQGPVVIFVSPKENNDDFLENLNVIVAPTEEPVTLDEYTDAGINQLKQMFTELNILNRDKMTLSGKPAIRIVYEASKDGQTNKLMQVISKSNNTFFIITYTGSLNGYERSLATAQEMIQSFRIK